MPCYMNLTGFFAYNIIWDRARQSSFICLYYQDTCLRVHILSLNINYLCIQ